MRKSLFYFQLRKKGRGFELETETNSIYQKWKIEYKKLEDELQSFRAYFLSVKKCECEIGECKHYKKARHKIFGERIDRIFNMKLQSSIQFYQETIGSANKT